MKKGVRKAKREEGFGMETPNREPQDGFADIGAPNAEPAFSVLSEALAAAGNLRCFLSRAIAAAGTPLLRLRMAG